MTTGLGWPKKARHARRRPQVALLFSDPTGSGIERPSMVLVQGIAEVDDADLDANRERYARDAAAKFDRRDPPPSGARFDWYFARIYLHVRPERLLVWHDGDCEAEPERIELAAVPEEPASAPPPAAPSQPSGRGSSSRIRELGRRYGTAVLSTVARDGYPFSIRVPVGSDRRGRTIRIHANPAATLPLLPGPACLTAHDHDEQLAWYRNFQVRGYLQGDRIDGWTVTPQEVVDGFELPPVGSLTRAIANYRKIRRFRRTAKRERARRGRG